MPSALPRRVVAQLPPEHLHTRIQLYIVGCAALLLGLALGRLSSSPGPCVGVDGVAGDWAVVARGSSVTVTAQGSATEQNAQADTCAQPAGADGGSDLSAQLARAPVLLREQVREVARRMLLPLPPNVDMPSSSSSCSARRAPTAPEVSCEAYPRRFSLGDGVSPSMDYLPASFPGLQSLPSVADAACPLLGPGAASEAAWMRILSRLTTADASGLPYKVVALGGSEAAGVACTNEVVTGKACAWSARFASWLRAVFPCADATLFNYASGGTTLTAGMASLHSWLHAPPDSDLLLVDFIVNDAFYDQVHRDRKFGTIPVSLSAAYEQFIIQARETRPDLDLVFVNTCALPRCGDLARMIEGLAAHYGVPVISYGAVVAAASAAPPLCGKQDGTGEWWGPGDLTHPRWQVHQLMGEVVGACFAKRWGSLCGGGEGADGKGGTEVAGGPAPVTPSGGRAVVRVSLVPYSLPNVTVNKAADLLKVSTCDRPTTFYSALDLLPKAKRGEPMDGIAWRSWPLFEDRENKPGFIANASDAEITFTIRFGASPRLILTYLRSYTGLGKVDMSIDGVPLPADMGGAAKGTRVVTLDGLYAPGTPEFAAHASQSFLVSFQVQLDAFQPLEGLDGVLGFNINPHTTHTLRFKARPDPPTHKFKLLTVTAC